MATPILTEDENTKDTLGYQVFIIEAMMSPFAEYLDPNQIIDSLGFEAVVKEDIEGKGRREGARQLVQEVLKEPREHVSLFIAALREMGFERFIDVLDDRSENKDMKRAEEKYELMLLMLEGKLKEKIYPSEIIDDLVPLLGMGDCERILAKETKEGAIPACRDLFTCMKRKTSNWPVKFLDALHKNKPELLAKIDPSLENGDFAEISTGTRSDVADDSDEEDYLLALSDEEKQDYEDLEKDLLPSGRDGRPQFNTRKYQLELEQLETFRLTEDRNDPARRVIEDTMKQIEELMLHCSALNDKAIDSLLMKRPRERSSEPYGQWTVQIRYASRNVETGQSDGIYGVDVDRKRADMARSLYVMADQLFRYNAALEIHEMVRIKDVIFYLINELGHFCVRRNGIDVHVHREKDLQNLYTVTKMQLMRYEQSRGDDPKHNNPNLTFLSKTLLDLLKEKGFDSRTIIFVRTRATCEALVNWLNNDDHIPPELQSLHANIFTGVGVTEQGGGMTQVEQEEVLSSFRYGTKKVLLATSVAEEGLDIPECNITIRYNYVAKEITTIKTRGRSR